MRVEGLLSLQAHWKARRIKHRAGFERGLMLGALLIQAESMKQTPVDTGALRNSHRVRKLAGGNGRNSKGQFTGGGKSKASVAIEISVQVAYAIFVHERMDLYHPVGNAKFLENAARNSHEAVKALVKQEMDR